MTDSVKNLINFYKGKRVLVTGNTGFKGGWLTQILLNWRANVVGMALEPNTKPNLFEALEFHAQKNLKNYFIDIRNFRGVKDVIARERTEIIFHLAAQPLVRESYDKPLYTFETNTLGAINVLQAIKGSGGVRAAVMITTDKVYENKETEHPYREDDKLSGYDPYSGSKAAAEMAISSYAKAYFNPNDYGAKHKTLIASARAGNVIGGGDWSKDRIVPDIIRAVFETNEKIIIRSPGSVRPWQHVLEPLYGYLLLAKNLYEGKKDFSGAWNFGPDDKDHLNVGELVKRVIKILNQGSYATMLGNNDGKREAELLKLDVTKSKKFLGWQPCLGINKALEFTFDWYRDFYNGNTEIRKLTNEQIEKFFNNSL